VARIPDDDIERLKREVALERLVQTDGVELQRHGAADLIGRCPFHDDKTPSLVVTPKKNLWHCLGACQAGGSVIDWVMRSRKVSFRHAVEILSGEAAAVPTSRRRALPSPVKVDAEDNELLRQVALYYHETLKKSPEALAYLEQRGLTDPEVVDTFCLGFANRTLGYRLPGRAARERLQKLGVLRESGHEHFNGSLVIPILGADGNVLGMYGRKVTRESQLRKGTPLHLYLPGPHRGVFNPAALQVSKTVILCEALIDALTFWCAGFRNVTTSYGVEGFTPDIEEAFKNHGTERVLIAYDRDDAGDAAADKLAVKLQADGIECWRVQCPRGMDVNDYAYRVKPADKSLGVLLRNAVWLGKGRAPMLDHDFVADEPSVEVEASPIAPPDEERGRRLPEATRATSQAPIAEVSTLAPIEPSGTSSLAASPSSGDELNLAFGDRRYRVRGLSRNLAHGALKVNVMAAKGEGVHVDTLDLYSARQRASFIKQAAVELGAQEDTVKRDIGAMLLRLEQLHDEQINKTLEPKAPEVVLSEADKAAAMELLQDPRLVERILADFAACGVVGEETNKLTAYFGVISRLLEGPLAIIVQSSSAAGKTALMEGELAFVPDESKVKYSAMTGQSLFYMGQTNLKHKVLAVVEEQGAERAAYALKLLQSEGELTIASTGKDPATGKLVTHEYRVEGPVMIFLTTTAVEIDEELLNRCIVLTVDEDREQTRAIHRRQRQAQTLEGLLERRARPAVLKVHQDAQRLLKPILVTNPYAPRLTFLDDRTRTRRDHMKYLTLIRAIALLHQYQREVKTTEHRGATVPYIEVTLEDIALANKLAHQVLGRSLDELAPQTRRLLMALHAMVSQACEAQKLERSEYRFTRRQVREHAGLSYEQVRVHLDRLVQLEYVLAHTGGRGQSFIYELLYDGQGQAGDPFLAGLIDVDALQARSTTATLGGLDMGFGGPYRPHAGALPALYRSGAIAVSSAPVATELGSATCDDETAHPDAAPAVHRIATGVR
jgi:DNA primase